MNAFQRKLLCAALASAGAVGVATTAQAVNLNPNGLGQVLIYPYYTVRADAAGNAYNTLLTVVNSTASVKSVKVRFLEGKDSREAIDFNLFLSPHDVWVTALTASSATAGGRALVLDKSCTLPAIAVSQGGLGYVDFVNFAFSGSNDDAGGTGLDRTKEGYVEIIEMATYATGSTVAILATHSGGVPTCTGLSDTIAASEALPPNGGLFGGNTLINVNDGTDYTEDAVALDNFTIAADYQAAGVTTPDLTFAAPPISQVLANGLAYTSAWAGGNADPVSAVLMHDQVMNVYVDDVATRSGTDWVITFPTKRFYVQTGTGSAPRLFQRNFNDGSGSCDDVSLGIYDREERTSSTPQNFSPPPPNPVNAVCWEANVLTFNNSNVLASTNNVNLNVSALSFEHGWLNVGFFPGTVTGLVHQLGNAATSITTIGGATTAPAAHTYFGLPVVGFEVESYTNGTLVVGGVNVLSNYGGNFVHKTTTRIQ